MTRLLPPLTELTRDYWQGCRAGELRLQSCQACGQYQFYPRNICSHCSSVDLQWARASGRGKVASFTIVRRGISQAYKAPYVVALIDLEEGPRMMSNIVGETSGDIAIGRLVTADFEAWSEEISMPVFRLVDAGGQQ